MTRADPPPPEETTAPPRVLVLGVSKRYASAGGTVTALDDVSLAIPAGSFFTLLGPSGCGKTTLLRILAGFEHPDAGTIVLDGRHVANDPPAIRPINTVFQSYALFPHMSVAENVAFGLERQHLPRARIAQRVAEMLALVRLDGYERRRPSQLSGGQQQRVALARAIAPQPKLLLLDEPLSALDRRLREEMQAELKRIQRECGLTFLLVTHDQSEALSMSDGIAVMNEGRVLQTGVPRAIYERPATRFVADFMGANLLPGALFGMSAPFAAVRPEAIEVGAADLHDHALDGQVESTAYLGARTSCIVALADGTAVRVERGDLHTGVEPGMPVRLRVDRGAVVPLAD